MKRLILVIFTAFALTSTLFAQTTPPAPLPAPDAAEITKLLNDFMANGATRNDYDWHDKFWADDVIYTRAAGVRTTKAEIMRGRNAPPPPAGAPTAVFTAEDVRIQQYGTTAIVVFQLVAKLTDGGETRTSKYLNTATMLKRKGKWQVVGYQVTPAPRSEEDSKKEVLAAEADLWKAVLAGDAKKLKTLVDDKFVWVHHSGGQDNAQKFVGDVASGALKYAQLTTKDITVTVVGDTAIVRGTSDRQRAGQNPFTTFYTITFINRGGAWRAISLHTSRVV